MAAKDSDHFKTKDLDNFKETLLKKKSELIQLLHKNQSYGREIDSEGEAMDIVDSLAADSERKRDLAYAALANLLLGQVHDLEGRRAEAITRYERVRDLPDYAESRDRAKRYLREPYGDGEE